MGDTNKTFRGPDGTLYRVNEDGTYTKIKSPEPPGSKNPEDNTIVRDGKKFRIEDDGSFTYLGEVGGNKQPHENDSPRIENKHQPEHKSSKRRGSWFFLGLIIVIIIIALIIIINRDQSTPYTGNAGKDFSDSMTEPGYSNINQDVQEAAAVEEVSEVKSAVQPMKEPQYQVPVFHWNDFIEYDYEYGYLVKDYNYLMQDLMNRGFVLTDTDSWTVDVSLDDEYPEYVETTMWTFNYRNPDGMTVYEINVYNSSLTLDIRVNDQNLYSALKSEFERIDFTVMPDGYTIDYKFPIYRNNTIEIGWDLD